MHLAAGDLKKRPPLVWPIVIACVLGTLASWSTLLLVSSGVLGVEPGARAYLAHFDRFDYAFFSLRSVATLAAALSLFLLRKAALYLFLATLALYLLNILLYATPESEAGLGSYWNGQEFIKLGFQLAAIYYCWRLRRRGVLS
jgi:hypothetical protein